MMDMMSPEALSVLLSRDEQWRRNARALVFVPSLSLKHDVGVEGRRVFMDEVRRIVSGGVFDRHGRRPRPRWELRTEQRPLSRLLGMSWRLSERLTALVPTVAKWKVQASGMDTEMWQLSGRRVRADCVGSDPCRV